MATAKEKAGLGMTLLILFPVTLLTGIALHLKKHGVVMEPRSLINVVHCASGILMVILTCWYGKQFWKMLSAMKSRFRWFWCDTWAVMFLTFITFATGLVKLISPVKIPHLGLWHYGIGIAMAVVIAIHLVRGFPSWNRLRKIK